MWHFRNGLGLLVGHIITMPCFCWHQIGWRLRAYFADLGLTNSNSPITWGLHVPWQVEQQVDLLGDLAFDLFGKRLSPILGDLSILPFPYYVHVPNESISLPSCSSPSISLFLCLALDSQLLSSRQSNLYLYPTRNLSVWLLQAKRSLLSQVCPSLMVVFSVNCMFRVGSGGV